MAVTEVHRALGSWQLALRPDVPRELWDQLAYFGHVTIHAGPLDVRVAGDSALSSARYVGVLRTMGNADTYTLGGPGLAMWLGDEDGKGWVIENLLAITAQTLENATRLILPPASSALAEGTYFGLPGNPVFTGTFQWQTQREALNYLVDSMGAEWRIRGAGLLDVGPASSLFVTAPTAAIVRKNDGIDLGLRAFSGIFSTEREMEDFTTRAVLLIDDGSGGVSSAAADILPGLNPYLDLRGNAVRLTRLISESNTDATNAPARAQLQLNRFTSSKDGISLSTAQYDVKGDVAVGDYVWVFDPDIGVKDAGNEVIFRGTVMQPMKLRLIEMSWPVREGMFVSYRDRNGNWFDLTPYLVTETGDTSLIVSGFNPLAADGADGGAGLPNPVPQPNLTIPNAPTWVTPFVQGTYQSPINGDTKAQTQLAWTLPTNTDGTVVTDAAYYEIRYRSSTTPLFPVTHAQMAVYTHAQLAANGGTWGQPIQYPVTDWQYQRVPATELKTIIYELTPAMPYEAQVRLVDNGTPANAGAWSLLTQWQSVRDNLGPSAPAAPSVASSLIAVQVTHFLGKSSGGSFNLERDLHHLEIHGQYEPLFTPSEVTRLGRLIANSNLMVAQIPVVGTFPVSQTAPMYFKVIAVDEAGNKSQPSPPAVASATLIDNAHISDLSVSKLTAGTILASFVHAGWMRIGAGTPGSGLGPAVELTPGSIQVINPSNGLAFDINSTTGSLRLFGGGGIEIHSGSIEVKNAGGQTIIELGECLDGRHGLQVYTDTGQRVARVGELAAGGHGIEVIDEITGGLVKVSTLAFGMRAGSVGGVQDPGNTGGAFVDMGGPSATVTIGDTGRAIVLVCTGMNTVGNGSHGAGYAISGNTTRAASTNEIVAIVANSTFHPSESFCNAFVATGLIPGSNTFTMKYFSNNGCLFFTRNIIVIPF